MLPRHGRAPGHLRLALWKKKDVDARREAGHDVEMTSPNRTLKILILGNLLPIHNPLRIAEELAMADCISRGRILSGFARGVPREYNVYNVPMAESRARFDEAVDIIMKAWTSQQFSHD